MFSGANIGNSIIGDNFSFENAKEAQLMFDSAIIPNHNISFVELTAPNIEDAQLMFANSQIGEEVDLTGFNFSNLNESTIKRIFANTGFGKIIVKDIATKTLLEGTEMIPTGLTIIMK